MDRDVVAAINISRKLPPRFRGRDDTSEAQSGIKPAMTEPRTPVIQLDMSRGVGIVTACSAREMYQICTRTTVPKSIFSRNSSWKYTWIPLGN